jgi:hypothetical protein
MKTKIYRFEHQTRGFGPMCGDGCEVLRRSWDCFFRYHDPVTSFEEFETWFPKGIQEHHKFGMSTLDGLLDLCYSWTPEDLLDCGFDLYEFEVEDYVVFPDGQVVFDSRTAVRIE